MLPSPSRLRCWLIVCSVLQAARVLACGPSLDRSILAQRSSRLLTLHEGGFITEMRRVAGEPLDDMPLVGATKDDFRAAAEHQGLSPAQDDVLNRAREQPDGATAYASGESLPAAVRMYAAGAVEFHAGNYEEALHWFEKILELPPAERQIREVWANFMIGRCGQLLSDRYDRSRAAFARTRELVRGGAADPLGLGVASLGEEARLCLLNNDAAAAVALYLEQARYDDSGAMRSLVIVRSRAFRDAGIMSQLTASPVGMRLLIAAYFTYTDARKNSDLVGAFESELRARAADNVEDADRAAAALYRRGEYELAAAFARRSDAALAHWVRAKLAVRAGDLDTARAEFAEAIDRLPAADPWEDFAGAFPEPDAASVDPRVLAVGDAAVLATVRGQLTDALRLFLTTGRKYWYDAAYLAERVLTIPELQQFVDNEVPRKAEPLDLVGNEEAYNTWQPNIPTTLRRLLARRLMRAGKYDAALGYFDVPAERAAAADLATSLHAARRSSGIDRAEHLWKAAQTLRRSGMEVVGFELSPDYAIYGGEFALSPEEPPRQPPGMTTALEVERCEATNPAGLPRHHYRWEAASTAAQAADLVPPRSQAYAALLCHATHWLIDRDPERARSLYQLYLARGAVVPFGPTFGRLCPDPDFERARQLESRLRRDRLRRIGGVLLTVITLGSLLALGVRRYARKA